ncbi:MAG: DUF2288 domain-containing protein [Gammaproteobacteria bacterium]|nr:DUF2288 domain-containing protein [Gammaproteobacteria bacterium]
MSDIEDSADKELINQLHSETAKLPWNELERHFARGSVIRVRKGLDLIKVAVVIANDDKDSLKKWLDSGDVANASTDDAKNWSACESEFWTVVVAPFVIVQEIDRKLDS